MTINLKLSWYQLSSDGQSYSLQTKNIEHYNEKNAQEMICPSNMHRSIYEIIFNNRRGGQMTKANKYYFEKEGDEYTDYHSLHVE